MILVFHMHKIRHIILVLLDTLGPLQVLVITLLHQALVLIPVALILFPILEAVEVTRHLMVVAASHLLL